MSQRRRRRRRNRFSNLRRIATWIGLAILALVIFPAVMSVSGCWRRDNVLADHDTSAAIAQSASHAIRSDELADIRTVALKLPDSRDANLFGRWIGAAGIDSERVAAKSASMPPEIRNTFQASVDAHLATLVSAEFGSDYRMTLEIENEKAQSPESTVQSFTGQWQVVQRNDDATTVAATLKDNFGRIHECRWKFRPIPGSDHYALAAPSSPELTDCRPLYFFKKIDQRVASKRSGLRDPSVNR